MIARIELSWVAPWLQGHLPHGIALIAVAVALSAALGLIASFIPDYD